MPVFGQQILYLYVTYALSCDADMGMYAAAAQSIVQDVGYPTIQYPRVWAPRKSLSAT